MGMYSSAPAPQVSKTEFDEKTSARIAGVYERQMDISERQQEWAETEWSRFTEIFAPYEEEMVAMNRRLLPGMEEVGEATIEAQKEELGLAKPLREKFYKEATEGVDVNERMGLATADVAQAFKGAEGSLRRTSARMGRNVSSADLRKMALEEAKATGFGRSVARREAESENFGRLAVGMSQAGRATGLPSGDVGGYGMKSPVNTAGGLMTNASNVSAGPTSGTVTKTGGPKESTGLMKLIGTIGGAAVSKYSDERLKKDIEHVSTVNNIEIVKYKWADFFDPNDDEVKIGVIAQQVKEVRPDLVHEALFKGVPFLTIDLDGVIQHLEQ